MRPSNLATHRHLLEALRRGEVRFDNAARHLRPALEIRAERFLRVWGWSGQTSVGAEDLIQEMLLTLWQAVDTWDPSRTEDVVRYVDAQLGRSCQRRLRKACGYPDKRRSAPARQVVVTDVVETAERLGAIQEVDLAEAAVDARRRAQALVGELAGLERLVVTLVLEGRSLDETTQTIYADRSARITYQFDSMQHARRLVGEAVRRATNAASASA